MSPDEKTISAPIRLRRSVQRLARQLRFRRSDQEVSGTKRSVLGSLFRSGRPLTASELARLEHLQPQSLTRVVAELEEARMIRREEDESDRRQLLISITEAGKNLLITDAQSQCRWLGSVMSSHLSKAEQDILAIAADLIDKVCDASDAQEKPGPDASQSSDEGAPQTSL